MNQQVLLVDDEPSLCRAFTRVLRGAGYLVASANDVPTALEMVADAPPAMLLTDYNLGGDTGLRLVMVIRERWPALPVVLMTGALSDEIQDVAQLLRIRTCLRKPIAAAALIEVVGATIGPPAHLPW